jgi:hypothetical protein
MLRKKEEFVINFTKNQNEVKESKDAYIKYHVKRFKDNGYNPIHIFGDWFLVRHKSKNYTKISYYKLFNMAKHYK